MSSILPPDLSAAMDQSRAWADESFTKLVGFARESLYAVDGDVNVVLAVLADALSHADDRMCRSLLLAAVLREASKP